LVDLYEPDKGQSEYFKQVFHDWTPVFFVVGSGSGSWRFL
jgi:hypothetical protein